MWLKAGTALVVATSGLAALWLGEHPTGLFDGRSLVIAVGLALLAAAPFRPGQRSSGLVAALCVLAAFAGGWVYGGRSHSAAFNECVDHGERVRDYLADYKRHSGDFPESLAQLGRGLPCQLVLPPQLLRYERTDTGYTLTFRDWLVSHIATESQPFTAIK